ncbi:chemotaxis protein CheA [Cohnella rhizosphaerae]|uniref:Chemotaxis protein CheA n=1 Tax=Cohnella rhizosphaerae TaxID=1457232 RepID=A0A9X4KZ69_9BACL|nr:chemotaxis protein CheA [Cohnella rhizosphaerae]MDG0813662.1 chemotaxis protein CheA [Cohnella rhizosphaerae]
MNPQEPSDALTDMYFLEAYQLIGQIEELALASEKSGGFSPEDIAALFRSLHTLKGSSAMMQYRRIADISHALEDVFDDLRKRHDDPRNGRPLADLVLRTVDYCRSELAHRERGLGHPGEPTALLEEAAGMRIQSGASGKQANCYSALVRFSDPCPMISVRAYQLIARLREVCLRIDHSPDNLVDDASSSEVLESLGLLVMLESDMDYSSIVTYIQNNLYIESVNVTRLISWADAREASESGRSAPTDISQAPAPQAPTSREPAPRDPQAAVPAEKTGVSPKPIASQTVSVPVAKLDRLVDLVGELVVTESVVGQSEAADPEGSGRLRQAQSQLRKITTELQDSVLSLRMVPIAALFGKMNRVARDMTAKLGKQADMIIDGEQTELDKLVIDQISDPLMHLVRNCIDHGIELPEERAAAGKPPAGIVRLRAISIGGDVMLTVEDDGRGLDRQRLLEKAQAAGLLRDVAREPSDSEIYNFIFMPGLTTREQISEFSGRGVGMDVVARNVAQVSGSIAVDSEQGRYTRFTLKIPLTLAIIDGMHLRAGLTRYTIPTVSVRESFRPAPEQIIHSPDGGRMLLSRGRCVPVLRLGPAQVDERDDGPARILVMVEQGDRAVCLEADELLGQQQIVIKPLPPLVARHLTSGKISGCTLLGDGSISLILNTGAWLAGDDRIQAERLAAVIEGNA